MTQPTPRQRTGARAEQQALEYLEGAGLCLVERNFRCRYGEIDLIMFDTETVVFVEVRFRRNSLFGGPAASVDQRKRQRLITTAEHFLQKHAALRRRPARFDIVAVTEPNAIEWIPNAFGT